MSEIDQSLARLMKEKRCDFYTAVKALCEQTGDTPMGALHNLDPKVDDSRDPNIAITKDELAFIRRLSDFDLMMFLSEIDGHGWRMARRTLWLIWEQPEYQKPAQKRGTR